MFPGVRLKLKGQAKVHWSESSGSGKNRRTRSYRAEEIYIAEEVYIYGSREFSFCIILNSTDPHQSLHVVKNADM